MLCSAAITAANAHLICTCTLSLVLCQLCLATFTDDAHRCDLGAVCVEEMEQVEVSPQKSLKLHFQTVLHKRWRASVEKVCRAAVGESTVYWSENHQRLFQPAPF